VDNTSRRRRKKSEENNPQLLLDIQKLVDPHSHADHQLRTDLARRNRSKKGFIVFVEGDLCCG